VFSCYRLCSLAIERVLLGDLLPRTDWLCSTCSIECVLLLQNVFSYYRTCSLTLQRVSSGDLLRRSDCMMMWRLCMMMWRMCMMMWRMCMMMWRMCMMMWRMSLETGDLLRRADCFSDQGLPHCTQGRMCSLTIERVLLLLNRLKVEWVLLL
jgi:hypothetical protein